MFTIYTFLVDNEKVEEEKLQRWSWFKMIAIKPKREEEQQQQKKSEAAQGKEK